MFSSSLNKILKNRVGNENFVSRGMQTFNNALKNKDVQVSAPVMKDASTIATRWDVSLPYFLIFCILNVIDI